MALTNSQYETIMREYENRQTRNRHLLEERTAEIYRQVEGYREIAESIAAISVSQGKKLLEGDEHALEDLKASIRSLSSMKEQLLTGRATLPITCRQCTIAPAATTLAILTAPSVIVLNRLSLTFCMSSPASGNCLRRKTFIRFLTNTIRERILPALKRLWMKAENL